VPTQAGDTALHLAARAGHIPVVQELLRAGADPTAKNQVRWDAHGDKDAAPAPMGIRAWLITHLGTWAGIASLLSVYKVNHLERLTCSASSYCTHAWCMLDGIAACNAYVRVPYVVSSPLQVNSQSVAPLGAPFCAAALLLLKTPCACPVDQTIDRSKQPPSPHGDTVQLPLHLERKLQNEAWLRSRGQGHSQPGGGLISCPWLSR
jgi:hypothetical protein